VILRLEVLLTPVAKEEEEEEEEGVRAWLTFFSNRAKVGKSVERLVVVLLVLAMLKCLLDFLVDLFFTGAFLASDAWAYREATTLNSGNQLN
jgi:hypothetical protein